MIISGLISSNISFKFFLTSPILEFIYDSSSSKLNKFGSVGGGFSENPDTFAFQFINIWESQDPLKPVCPVINIFLPLKNFSILNNSVNRMLFPNAPWGIIIVPHFF